jgi:LAO/AO transport system kinase
MFENLQKEIQENGNIKALARCISLIENEVPGYDLLLANLPIVPTKIIGITGPPGAGKSTLVDALLHGMVNANKKVAVLCVDPSSPFHLGALLGDRVRMNRWYNHPQVYIRSLASRGSLGGLHPKIIEITDLVKTASFDFVIVETVGVGQNEIEIAGLADVTVVVMVPEGGDEVQTMKSGLIEIADIFVVNKADRPGADLLANHLKQLSIAQTPSPLPVLTTTATTGEGVGILLENITVALQKANTTERKYWLLAEKAYALIVQYQMKNISKQTIFEALQQQQIQNVYQYLKEKQFIFSTTNQKIP